MIIGFTGTREGMTSKQYQTVVRLLGELKPDTVVHGDCYGSDTDFHKICMKIKGGILGNNPPSIVIRPSNLSTRAHNDGADIIHPEKAPLNRDLDIAQNCDKLIATPRQDTEVLRSGTWTTIRYARRFGKVIYIVKTNGEIA